jgi:hypothetical protein
MAESRGIVPTQVKHGSATAEVLERWWSQPRTVGCRHVTEPWVVLLPDPSVRCLQCSGEILTTTGACRACARCGEPLTEDAPAVVVVENDGVTFVSRLCTNCDERSV